MNAHDKLMAALEAWGDYTGDAVDVWQAYEKYKAAGKGALVLDAVDYVDLETNEPYILHEVLMNNRYLRQQETQPHPGKCYRVLESDND